MAVDRCICHQTRFVDIKRYAETEGITSVEELMERGISSTNCKLCVPYIEQMFKTGETSFDPKIFREFSRES
jgi:bacterioferritin-associated ferredoxin